MRARPRVPKKCADLIGRLWRKNMLEFASLLFDLGFAIHCQAIGEQALRQAVSTNDAPRSCPPPRREFRD